MRDGGSARGRRRAQLRRVQLALLVAFALALGPLTPTPLIPDPAAAGSESHDTPVAGGPSGDDAKRGRIIVRKRTDPPGSKQAFTFVASYRTPFKLKDGKAKNSGALKPGTYSVTEQVPAGWTLVSATCDDGSDPAAIELSAGEHVTCTFVNRGGTPTTTTTTTTPQPERGVIEVRKVAGGSNQTFAFSGALTASLRHNQTATEEVPAGTHTVTEAAVAGWRVQSISCNDTNSTANTATRTATFNVEPGERVRCTFTNVPGGHGGDSGGFTVGGEGVVTGGGACDVAATVRVSQDEARLGELVTLFVTALNLSDACTATGVVVDVTVPAGMSFVGAEGEGTYNGETGRWTVGNLEPKGSADVALLYLVEGELFREVVVKVSTDQGDPDPSNNKAFAVLTAGSASITGAIFEDANDNGTRDPDEGPARGQVTVTLTNPLNGASVARVGDAAFTFGALPSPNTYTLSVRDVPRATPSASLRAAGRNVPLPARLDLARNQRLSVDLVLAREPFVDVEVSLTAARHGDTVTITVLATNLGTAAATGISIAMPIPDGVTLRSHQGTGFDPEASLWTVARLEPGETQRLLLEATIERDAVMTVQARPREQDRAPDNNSARLELLKGGSLVGTVSAEINVNGRQEPVEGLVRSGLLVTLEGPDRRETVELRHGGFRFAGLEPGASYTVRLEPDSLPEGYPVDDADLVRTVQVDASGEVALVSFFLDAQYFLDEALFGIPVPEPPGLPGGRALSPATIALSAVLLALLLGAALYVRHARRDPELPA